MHPRQLHRTPIGTAVGSLFLIDRKLVETDELVFEGIIKAAVGGLRAFILRNHLRSGYLGVVLTYAERGGHELAMERPHGLGY
jgi:hypothetical protein